MSSLPSYLSDPFLDAKECGELISQYFTNEIVHGYYTCPSRMCSSQGHQEVARLKNQKKKHLHTWHQEKENWWLCYVERKGMYCLLFKEQAVKTAQNKKESAFTQTPGSRMKYDAIKTDQNSDQHKKAVRREQWQCMSIFHKEVVERKVIANNVLERAFSVAYFLAKEHIAKRKFLCHLNATRRIREYTLQKEAF